MARWTCKNEQSKREGGVLGRSPRRQRHVLDHSLLGQQCRVRQSAVFQVWVSFQRNSSSTNLDTALNVRWFLFNQITGWFACSHLPANDLKGISRAWGRMKSLDRKRAMCSFSSCGIKLDLTIFVNMVKGDSKGDFPNGDIKEVETVFTHKKRRH